MGPDGLPASRAWCFTARKPLCLRCRAPRRMGESEHGDGRRGASPPANPYPFVVEHHAGWANRSTGTDGVVLHRPQTLIPSSSSTTPDGRIGARGRTAWCLTAHKPLSLRRRAPRRMGESEHGDGRRGASPPANPCFFVEGHHAPDSLHTGQFREPAPGSRNSHLPQKTKNVGQGAAPAAPCRHFPFPYQSVETVPLCTLRGQSLSYPNPLLCFALLCFALLCSAEFSKK